MITCNATTFLAASDVDRSWSFAATARVFRLRRRRTRRASSADGAALGDHAACHAEPHAALTGGGLVIADAVRTVSYRAERLETPGVEAG